MYACGLIQVVSERSIKRTSVSSLVLLSSCSALKDWKEMLYLCVFLITATVKLTLASPLQVLDALCALDYFTMPVFALLEC